MSWKASGSAKSENSLTILLRIYHIKFLGIEFLRDPSFTNKGQVVCISHENVSNFRPFPSILFINPSGAKTGIIHENLVNTIAADALAPCVARSSAAMLLIMWDHQVLVFDEQEFLVLVPSRCREKMENIKTYFYVLSETSKAEGIRTQNANQPYDFLFSHPSL